MRKVLFFAFLFVSFSASAQWTIINGKQRFAKGLGIPVSDTVATLLNDSAQIVLRPQDSAVYYKLHGKWMKLNGTGGGGSTPNLQQVTDQGATTTNYVGVQGLYVYDSFSGGYQIIDGNIDGGLNFYNKNGDTLFHYGGGGIAGYDMGIGINRPANGDRAFIRMNTGNNEYLLPSTSGTLALTSDISYPDTTTIATHHYVDSSIVASVPTLNEVLSNGHITYGKEIDMYDTIVNGSEIYISPLYQGAFIGMKDSTNKYIEIGINNNAYNTPSLYFQTKNRGQFLNYIDSSFGNLFLPYQNNQVDTLATRHYVDSSVSTKLKISDTANKWVNSVTGLNDSTIRVVKNGTTTDITIRSSATVTSATRLITQVWNSSGATIPRGAVVYINGAHSSVLPSIALAKANAESTSAYTYGLVVDDIANNSEGTVIQNGTITNLNLPTSSYTDGQTLYLSPTVAGGYTTTKPLAPYHYVAIGTITRAHPNFGTIQVAIRNGFQLDEMSDVKIALVPNDSTLLQFSRVDSLWHDVSPTTAIGTRYIKPSDTATMLSKYFNNTNYGLSKSSQIISVDTSTLSNKYHRLNDSLTYFSKYRSDTMRTNIYTAINGKQASGNYITTSDTSTMLSKYLRKTDTATLSARIDTKIGTSDTSVFQRKTIASYSFVANNTNASASVTTQSFRDSSGTYSGTPTFTGTTAPSGTTNHTYRWVQVGKQVTVWVNLVFGTAGSAITACTIPFPSTLPTPASPTGISGANAILYTGSGSIQVDGVTLPSGSTFVSAIQINSSNNGYNVYVFRSSGSSINPKNIYATIQYYAQ